MINACISLLSSRSACLPLCLKSLWDHWNYKYNYPVYIHYFDDIYDNAEIRDQIKKFSSGDLRFISVPYKTPPHIKEEELFYNRQDIQYVRSGFSQARKGYLHMCHFFNNLYGYPNTEFEKYDYMLSIDDEATFLKEVPYDFFKVIQDLPDHAGVIKMTDPQVKKPHQGWFDTRVGMVDFVLQYLKDNNTPKKCDFIKDLCSSSEPESFFHNNLMVGDSWVFKTSVFETPEWKNWSKSIYENGGVYKYRWGDCELNVLFFLIHYGELPHDFKTVDEGYHNQGGLRHMQDIAPSIKNLDL